MLFSEKFLHLFECLPLCLRQEKRRGDEIDHGAAGKSVAHLRPWSEPTARGPSKGRRLQALEAEAAFAGAQAQRYELRPEDLLAADKAARERRMDLIGIYHSHPDCDAYFSKTDLQNSCPWYSFVVLSIQKGEFHHANSWLPNFEQTEAAKEELSY